MADSDVRAAQRTAGRQRRVVQWYGTHPAENIASMDVYRESLLREISADDDFEIRCWPPAGSRNPKAGNGAGGGPLSRIIRAGKKYPGYARRVRATPTDTDIVHLLDHSMAHLLRSVPAGIKTVVTVHDLIPLRYPGEQTPAQQKRFRRNVENLRDADAMVAVSEFTRSEIVERLGICRERIRVVPNGVSVPAVVAENCAAVDQLRASGADAVLLSVGTTLQRKNLDILPGALKSAADLCGKRLALLRIGERLDSTLARRLQTVLGEDRLVELGRVDEAALWSAYRAADALVFPSLHEGFGLPVLEALACGTAVAASRVASIREVGGQVVKYFAPDESKEAGEAIARAIETAKGNSERLARTAHAREFSWGRHLLACRKLYGELCA